MRSQQQRSNVMSALAIGVLVLFAVMLDRAMFRSDYAEMCATAAINAQHSGRPTDRDSNGYRYGPAKYATQVGTCVYVCVCVCVFVNTAVFKLAACFVTRVAARRRCAGRAVDVAHLGRWRCVVVARACAVVPLCARFAIVYSACD